MKRQFQSVLVFFTAITILTGGNLACNKGKSKFETDPKEIIVGAKCLCNSNKEVDVDIKGKDASKIGVKTIKVRVSTGDAKIVRVDPTDFSAQLNGPKVYFGTTKVDCLKRGVKSHINIIDITDKDFKPLKVPVICALGITMENNSVFSLMKVRKGASAGTKIKVDIDVLSTEAVRLKIDFSGDAKDHFLAHTVVSLPTIMKKVEYKVTCNKTGVKGKINIYVVDDKGVIDKRYQKLTCDVRCVGRG